MPSAMTPSGRSWRIRPTRTLRLVIVASVVAFVTGCSLFEQQSVILSTVGVPARPPQPTCGGVKILIEGALPCDQVASSAIATLARQAPDHMARGVTAIDVTLAECPSGAVPANIDCLGNEFAQFVKVTFGPPPPEGPLEPWLTVVVDPVSGQLLGIENPLIR